MAGVGRAFSSPAGSGQNLCPSPRQTPPNSQAAPQEFGTGPGDAAGSWEASTEACGVGASVGGLWGLQVGRRCGLASPRLARKPLPGHRAGRPWAPEVGRGLAARPA